MPSYNFKISIQFYITKGSNMKKILPVSRVKDEDLMETQSLYPCSFWNININSIALFISKRL